jgi:ketosteroid isomerase-like protein
MTNSVRVRRGFDEVWNRDNEAAIEELMAADSIGYGLGPTIHGARGFREFYHGFRGSFDSVRVEIEHTIESGDEVAYRGRAFTRARGDDVTHEMVGAGFIRFRDGMVVEGYNYWDFLGLMAQMKAVPEDVVPRTLAAAAAVRAGS